MLILIRAAQGDSLGSSLHWFGPREAVACSVPAYSICTRCSARIGFASDAAAAAAGARKRAAFASNGRFFLYTFSGSLVERLRGMEPVSGLGGMLMLDDVAALCSLRDERFAVQVLKHDQRPRESTKFLGEPQTAHQKSWSSVMLFNNA
jgi:hypothetical protein